MTPHRRWVFALAVLLHLVVLYTPDAGGAPGVPFLDKAVHVLAFAAVVVTAGRAALPVPWVVGALVAHAPVSELVQATFLPARSGDPLDVLADLAGVVVGVLASGTAARLTARRDGETMEV